MTTTTTQSATERRGILATVAQLFGLRTLPDPGESIRAEIEARRSEVATLRQQADDAQAVLLEERELARAATVTAYLETGGARLIASTSEAFRALYAKAMAGGRSVEGATEQLEALAESLPDLTVLFEKLPPADTSAAERAAGLGGSDDAALDAEIQAEIKTAEDRGKTLDYAAAHGIVTRRRRGKP